jgi:hypothetical protein
MLNKSIGFAFIVVLGASTLPGSAQAQAQQGARVNLAGAYRCEPQPSRCPWPGQTMAIIQNDRTLSSRTIRGPSPTASSPATSR